MSFIKMKLIFSLLFILFSFNNLLSQNSVVVRDTIINRAISNKIPIYGKIEESTDSKFQFCLKFNSLVIDVKEIVVDNSTIFSSINSFDIFFNDYTNSEVLIKTNGLKDNNNGVLFYAIIEGLAGSDTTCLIEPSCFLVNDVVSDKVSLTNGRINVRSTPVDIDFKEGLGLNSPNPFYNQTKIPFTIDQKTKVDFKIYSLNGRKVLNKSFADAGFDFEITNNDGTIVNNPDNHTFEKGKYNLILRADSWKASAGAYYLLMTTTNSTYKINLMLIK